MIGATHPPKQKAEVSQLLERMHRCKTWRVAWDNFIFFPDFFACFFQRAPLKPQLCLRTQDGAETGAQTALWCTWNREKALCMFGHVDGSDSATNLHFWDEFWIWVLDASFGCEFWMQLEVSKWWQAGQAYSRGGDVKWVAYEIIWSVAANCGRTENFHKQNPPHRRKIARKIARDEATWPYILFLDWYFDKWQAPWLLVEFACALGCRIHLHRVA